MMQVYPSENVVSEYFYGDPLAHHDQHHLDNGSILYTTLAAMATEQAATIPGGVPKNEALDGTVYGDCINNVSPIGEVLCSWRAIKHLSPKVFPL
jgi:hypothetical protein